MLNFVIRNVWNGVAENIRVVVNQDFIDNVPDKLGQRLLSGLNDSKFSLVPQQYINIFIGSHINFDIVKRKQAIIELTYNNRYSERVLLDLNTYPDHVFNKTSVEDSLNQMRRDNENFYKQILNKIEKL